MYIDFYIYKRYYIIVLYIKRFYYKEIPVLRTVISTKRREKGLKKNKLLCYAK